MAIDISDLIELPDEHLRIGDLAPLRALFDAIAERWAVTGATAPRAQFPLDIEHHPVRHDRIEAIQNGVLALGERFLCLDADYCARAGWGTFPVYYTADVIAAFPDMAPVLVLPARGASCADEDLSLYAAFLRAAATCLSRFRYVNAEHYTAKPRLLKKTFHANWNDPSESYPGHWSLRGLGDEECEINGRRTVAQLPDHLPSVSSVVAQFDAADWIVQSAPSTPSWGLSRDYIAIGSIASARVESYPINNYTDPATHNTDSNVVGVWGVSRELDFAVSGVPDAIEICNPFGFFATALAVLCPGSGGLASHREQTTERCSTSRVDDNRSYLDEADDAIQTARKWREVVGEFRIVRDETYDSSTGAGHATETDYSDDGTRSRVFRDEATSRPCAGLGVSVKRDNWVDTFHFVPDESTADAPVGAAAKVATLFTLGPHARHSVGFAGSCASDFNPSAILAEAEANWSAGACDLSSLYIAGSCRLVPVLDFGAVFRADEDEDLDDWTGLGLHQQPLQEQAQ